jgi:hypothetical protein
MGTSSFPEVMNGDGSSNKGAFTSLCKRRCSLATSEQINIQRRNLMQYDCSENLRNEDIERKKQKAVAIVVI